MQQIKETSRSDIAVIGAGPAGFGAALAAARRGLKVYLLESGNLIGGIMATCPGMPIGAVFVSLIMLRSAWKCFRNGGIDWRGTHYPVDELRRGQRVKFSPMGQDINSG